MPKKKWLQNQSGAPLQQAETPKASFSKQQQELQRHLRQQSLRCFPATLFASRNLETASLTTAADPEKKLLRSSCHCWAAVVGIAKCPSYHKRVANALNDHHRGGHYRINNTTTTIKITTATKTPTSSPNQSREHLVCEKKVISRAGRRSRPDPLNAVKIRSPKTQNKKRRKKSRSVDCGFMI